MERLPRRQAHPVVSSSNTSVIGGAVSSTSSSAGGGGGGGSSGTIQLHAQSGIATTSSINGRDITITSNPMQLGTASSSGASSLLQSQINHSQFLLNRFMTPTLVESEQTQMECNRADRYVDTHTHTHNRF